MIKFKDMVNMVIWSDGNGWILKSGGVTLAALAAPSC